MPKDSNVLYSPLPPERYKIRNVEKYALDDEERRPLWNLYYLSSQSRLLPPPHRVFVQSDVLAACERTLPQKLGNHRVRALVVALNPPQLLGVLAREYHEHLEVYKLLGRAWLWQVKKRAAMFQGVVSKEGNVVHVQFGRAA